MKFVKSKTISGYFKKRNPDSTKGQNGRAVIIGGSSDFVGAPALSALSALSTLRSGADLATVIAPEKCGYAINALSPDIIVKKVSGKNFSKKHAKQVLAQCRKADAVLIGPGLGVKKTTQEFVKTIAAKIIAPMVIDADAIKALKGKVFSHNCIITPHRKEFEIFTGKTPEKFPVKNAAKKHKCIILLKGKTDVISDGTKVFYNKTGNSAMTVGGTGDILAGLCTGLAAQKIPLLNSAVAAAFINGKAGDTLFQKNSYGILASDFLNQIPLEIKKIRKTY